MKILLIILIITGVINLAFLVVTDWAMKGSTYNLIRENYPKKYNRVIIARVFNPFAALGVVFAVAKVIMGLKPKEYDADEDLTEEEIMEDIQRLVEKSFKNKNHD